MRLNNDELTNMAFFVTNTTVIKFRNFPKKKIAIFLIN